MPYSSTFLISNDIKAFYMRAESNQLTASPAPAPLGGVLLESLLSFTAAAAHSMRCK